MSNFTTIVLIGIASILLLLLIAGLLIGPASPAPGDVPELDEEGEALEPPPAGGDRRAGGPGFRSAALDVARRANIEPRRRRRLARQARSLNAAQSSAVSDLGDEDSAASADWSSRSHRSSAPE